jgi:hypothetical protein
LLRRGTKALRVSCACTTLQSDGPTWAAIGKGCLRKCIARDATATGASPAIARRNGLVTLTATRSSRACRPHVPGIRSCACVRCRQSSTVVNYACTPRAALLRGAT